MSILHRNVAGVAGLLSAPDAVLYRGSFTRADPHDMLELLTAKEMGEADRLTIAGGVSGARLMENAGRAVSEEVARRFPDAGAVAVLCGPGNNGGDGFVAARHLKEKGYAVRLGLLGNAATLPSDAAAMAKLWDGAIEPLTARLLAKADVVVDAIFGAGLARSIEGAPAEVIRAVECKRAAGRCC